MRHCVTVVMLLKIGERLFLTESWTSDKERCLAAGIPTDQIVAKSKHQLALELVTHAHSLKLGYHWIGCDGFYFDVPAFLRALNTMNEIFMADVHKDQHIYLTRTNQSFLLLH